MLKRFEIRFGTDGIGLTAGSTQALNIEQARVRAAHALRMQGYRLQADRGLFTVHALRDTQTKLPF